MAELVDAHVSGACVERHAGSSPVRSEEHTSELQSLREISYAVFCLKKKIFFFFQTIADSKKTPTFATAIERDSNDKMK